MVSPSASRKAQRVRRRLPSDRGAYQQRERQFVSPRIAHGHFPTRRYERWKLQVRPGRYCATSPRPVAKICSTMVERGFRHIRLHEIASRASPLARMQPACATSSTTCSRPGRSISPSRDRRHHRDAQDHRPAEAHSIELVPHCAHGRSHLPFASGAAGEYPYKGLNCYSAARGPVRSGPLRNKVRLQRLQLRIGSQLCRRRLPKLCTMIGQA
jgi:hypothetical protein